ncbi:MAG TPA: Stp1/IreP family PP2C-type Ser/Thr phosphatase [Gemmatimonadaceae bacterium]|nr:Stp1/IreP family PP2C-type Ser/Thr phosphatase [Gemmatimonadaceae bacterium]
MPARMSGTDPGDVIVHVFGLTDVGRTREHNEDSFLVVDLTEDNDTLQPEVQTHVGGPRGSLFMVADGLGGAAAGEIASDLAVQTVHEYLRTHWSNSTDEGPEAFAMAIKGAAETANQRIYAYAQEHPENRGLGTTATIAGLLGDTLFLAQVGDSRAYLIRNGEARQITKDQSLMQRLVEAGELTQDEAERSERRNIILQALGPEPSVRIDLTFQTLRRGDTLVLCTDGLSGLVKKDEIAEVVRQEPDLASACRELIERANENGGPDNITVIIARFDGEGLSDAGPDDHIGHAVFPLAGMLDTPSAPQPRLESAVPEIPSAMPRNHERDATPLLPEERPGGRLWIGALLIIALLVIALVVIRFARPSAPAPGMRTDSVSGRLSP